jgi:hypothetical protein
LFGSISRHLERKSIKLLLIGNSGRGIKKTLSIKGFSYFKG